MDLRIGFYEVPKMVSMQGPMKDINIVMCKSGFHDSWVMEEGSVQGFFPTGDSILHSLFTQWALRQAKAAKTIHKNAVIAKATLIDNIFMAINCIGTTPVEGIKSISDSYLRLGFVTNLVKTLMSTRKGHFLNRLYCNSHEVLTSAKIFSRSNRDHERKITTIHDRIGVVFCSMWGAMDRGADPIWAYYIAHWRAVNSIMQVAGKNWKSDSLYTSAFAWLPAGLGGLGIPSFAHWASHDATSTLASGLGVLSRLAKTIKATSAKTANLVRDVLYSIAHSKVCRKSYTAYMDDPFSVLLASIIDPVKPYMEVMKKAQAAVVSDEFFLCMMNNVYSDEYEAALEAFVKSGRYPTPIVAELTSVLPHAVVRGLTIKAEQNETLLKYVSLKDRKAAIAKTCKLNKAFITSLGTSIKMLKCPEDLCIDSAWVMRQLDAQLQGALGVDLVMTIHPSIWDIIVKVTDSLKALITLTLPDHTLEELFDSKGNCSAKRSKKSKVLVMYKHSNEDAWDPITHAYM
jgi:hypothetical protein